jgi:hypothetical protein
MRRGSPVVLALLVACGGTQHVSHDAGVTTHADPPQLPSDRALATTATFGDLVMAAVHQDDRRASDGDAGCLVRVVPSGFVLEADLSVAVRGLTGVPNDLGDPIEVHHGSTRVLTRLGSYGAPSPLTLAALTTLAGSPDHSAIVLALTPRGVYVLRTDAANDLRPIDVAHAVAAAPADATVFVTASAAMPMTDVVALLRALGPRDGRIALAALLPDGATMPADAASADEAPICADGLPPLPDDAPVGEADPASLRASLSVFGPAAEACVATSASGLGGLVRIAFRIGPDGHVRDACVSEDRAGDATLRACIVEAVRAVAFPAPTGGSVDVELPLRLDVEHDAAHHQRALCE